MPLSFVHSFRYLGHLLRNDQSDDDDIARETRNLYVRANILTRKFSKCSLSVKLLLFRCYCLCLYDIALWANYFAGYFNKLRSAYIKCMKLFFGYKRRDSVTAMLLDLNLLSFDTVMSNCHCSFAGQLSRCHNTLIVHFISLAL